MLAREIETEMASPVLPSGFTTLVERELKRSPKLPWEDALVSVLADVTPEASA